MNATLSIIENRRSVRAFADKPIARETVDAILHAAMRAPTAGNMMLYSIIEVTEQDIKDKLALSCDNQPFIAKAPLVLLFLADYQRWFDFFIASDVPAYCEANDIPLRYPGAGDLLLACCDALIAAQTGVIAAESLGIGSCYIGDIMEKYEYHKDLFGLPQYTFPVALLCCGYPKARGVTPHNSPPVLTQRTSILRIRINAWMQLPWLRCLLPASENVTLVLLVTWDKPFILGNSPRILRLR